MKATELMIGDLIKIKGHLDYDKVQEIARDENMQWYISFACSATLFRAYEFEPIPLTPEILEKNGFKKIDFSHYQINDRTLVLDADGKWDGEVSWHWVVTEMSTNSKGQNVVLDYYVATLNYAHQLQHALRLCGLNELADNFKV